ncbi:hypothetical protein PAEPH01_0996 [Pancytospora epiphaga]|nr:hypothetical protein PAEPH01_0996 [Pancytospora epiphaga]
MLFPKGIVDHEYQAVVKGEIKKFRLSQISTRLTVLIFYPLDFTWVCPTEIVKFAEMADDFLKEDATIVFASTDSVYSHLAWMDKKVEENGIGNINSIMISDISRKLAPQFNLLDEEAGTVMRGTVIIDNEFNVLHISANTNPVGRSSLEVLRLVKAINYYFEHGEVCPVDFLKNEKK